MISVAMTTYNSEKFIIKQLDSIVNQSLKVDEVVIIDDCSKDRTVEIISQYIQQNKLKSWRIISNRENLGYIKSFYKSICNTNGDIIILCDHDDEWIRDKVKIINDTFSCKNDMLALATSFQQIDGEGKDIFTKKYFMRSNNNLIRKHIKRGSIVNIGYKDIATYNVSPGCCCAFSSKIKDVFLEKFYNIPHDWKINIIAASKNGLYYLDKITTRYRIHKNNTIGLGHKISYNERKKVTIDGYKEKVEMVKLLKDINASHDMIEYFEKVSAAFLCKANYFSNPTLKNLVKSIFYSFGKSRLYESIPVDFVSCMIFRK